MVDFCDRKCRGEEGVEVVDGVEDGDEVEQCCNEPDSHLSAYRFGDIDVGIWDLFG